MIDCACIIKSFDCILMYAKCTVNKLINGSTDIFNLCYMEFFLEYFIPMCVKIINVWLGTYWIFYLFLCRTGGVPYSAWGKYIDIHTRYWLVNIEVISRKNSKIYFTHLFCHRSIIFLYIFISLAAVI